MNLIPRSFFFDDFFSESHKYNFYNMKCDIYEDSNDIIFEMDVPGFSKDDIDIDIENGYLTVSVSCHEELDDSRKYIRRERIDGFTKRQFYVGDVEEDSIKATFCDGVLKVVLPKKEKVFDKKKIEIE